MNNLTINEMLDYLGYTAEEREEFWKELYGED